MKSLPFAGLIGLASLGAQAQSAVPSAAVSDLDPVVVTATRASKPETTLADAVVITREEIEAAGPISLGELLQRHAGVELRATGGPGQPQGLFLRGAGTAQSLVLVDGLRVGSATVGQTAIENIPLELIERIEVVKGPASSLYGSDAIGGVVQLFTRAKGVPYLFATAGYGTNQDQRISAGLSTTEGDTSLSIAAGARKVDAPSATNPRVGFCYDPDRDPYENDFANVHLSHRLWQGEVLALEAFASRARTHFDGCPDFVTGTRFDDLNRQTIAGARFTSSSEFTSWWSSRIALGSGEDRIETSGSSVSRFKTRQDQASWINEVAIPGGSALAGLETLHQRVSSDTLFTKTRRDTDSGFLSVSQNWYGQRVEASARRDDDQAFGERTTWSAGYGFAWPSIGMLSIRYGTGFRAPTFFDLYAPEQFGFHGNPDLRPERSASREIGLRSEAASAWQWRLTGFDNRITDLIAFTGTTVENVNQARIRGVEASVEKLLWGIRWKASITAQHARDEANGERLQGRATRFGTLEASRTIGAWTAGLSVLASGDRPDRDADFNPTTLPGYAVADLHVRYRFAKLWSAEVTVANLADKRYENTFGYDAPRRSALLSVRFDAF